MPTCSLHSNLYYAVLIYYCQGTKLRVRLTLANARFASLLLKVMYIIKRKFKCLEWIWLLFHLVKWKKCIFHFCLRHSWNIHFFTSLHEIKVIFTPNIWISSMSLWPIFHSPEILSYSSHYFMPKCHIYR